MSINVTLRDSSPTKDFGISRIFSIAIIAAAGKNSGQARAILLLAVYNLAVSAHFLLKPID